MRSRPARRLRSLLANASLSVRIMVAATVLVMVTLAVMGAVGTSMLRSYLFGRVDAQLMAFASAPGPRRLPAGARRSRPPQLPTQFLVEEISSDGRVRVLGGSDHGVSPPKVSAARLRGGRPVHCCGCQPGALLEGAGAADGRGRPPGDRLQP